MKLNLSPSPAAASYHEEATGAATVALTLELSTGATLAMTVSVGETVAQVKKRIADSAGVPYASLTLSCDGVPTLLDPFSLNDVKQLRGKSAATIRVHVKQ